METVTFKSGGTLTGRMVMTMSHSVIFLSGGVMYLLNRHNITEGRYAFKNSGRP